MKTKNVYVYLVDDGGWLPWASTSEREAKRTRADDVRHGYTVSPIVKVALPLPGGGK